MIFLYSVSEPIKYHFFWLLLIFLVFQFHSWCCLPLYFPLPQVLVAVGVPFTRGPLSWMSLSGSFQIILPILLPWMMLWNFSLCCILNAMVPFPGVLFVLVCWILVLGQNIHLLYFMPQVLICRMHPNICGESFRFFCVLLLCMDVSWCNLKTELSILRYILLVFLYRCQWF